MESTRIVKPGTSLLIKMGLSIGEVFQSELSSDVVIVPGSDHVIERTVDAPPSPSEWRQSPIESSDFNAQRLTLKEITFFFRKKTYRINCIKSEHTGKVYVDMHTLYRDNA